MSSRIDLRAPKFNQEKGGLEVITSRLLKQSVVRRNESKTHTVFEKACQKQARAEKVQVRKMVPRRPNQLLKGIVSQQPMKAQQR
jgi:hypothetical protein